MPMMLADLSDRRTRRPRGNIYYSKGVVATNLHRARGELFKLAVCEQPLLKAREYFITCTACAMKDMNYL